ncbi:flagellar hook-basal body protein [Xylanibacillus composti]|uniref:Flagellar basal-body rod protein FlgG n=1 Tax=Xylanibacillus composti TaxID=1572762 RepID=A0A8J4H8V9_9BACL|nr:flagellar hook-basal body protein [Xylanibacillus composti]MDT9725968.1 flagellar hook-basal body protein [Xylanibacillus composti]GIQ70878.1 flagellar basal-body rod protein FlgG [Xylanibacillus composti]
MNNSIINASVSLHALQQKLDLLANNVANVNTEGYKRREVSFQDVLTAVKQQPEDFELPGRRTPLGITESWGARISPVQINFEQGSLKSTEQPLDIALEGNAMIELFEVQRGPDGQPLLGADGQPLMDRYFTRGGSFKIVQTEPGSMNGYLATQDGHLVRNINFEGELAPILIPLNHRIVIDTNGNISVYNDQSDSELPTVMGTLPLYQIKRPQLLENAGNNLFRVADNAVGNDDVMEAINLNGPRTAATRDIQVRQGFIEMSNVNLTEQMTELIAVQRAYQLTARALTSADRLSEMANNLRS